MGRKELTRVVRQKLIRRFGTAGAISSKVIDTALNYSSPGTMIAKYWDRHDAYPNMEELISGKNEKNNS